MTIFIDVDPNAPHAEDCGFWHGGMCGCTRHSRLALAREHCHECDWINAYSGSAVCNCQGYCVCDRLEGCPCVGRSVQNFGTAQNFGVRLRWLMERLR